MTTFAPRITATDPVCTQIQPFGCTVGFNGFYHVFRAGGRETAGTSDPGTQEISVEPNRCYEYFLDHADFALAK